MRFDRIARDARQNWAAILEDQGMRYHTIGELYWNESASYVLDMALVDKIEDATQQLHDMCMAFVADEIEAGDYVGYDFSDAAKSIIEASYKHTHPHLYGRFDLGIDKDFAIKMFEYNADTPTGLLEASVIQWNWKEDVEPDCDQFNSIHEKLIERWQGIGIAPRTRIHLTTLEEGGLEDWSNVAYLLETASLAGYEATDIALERIGWDGANFVDEGNAPINVLFKLYPWEWMIKDKFSAQIQESRTLFIEPAWKMLLSNKLLAVKLWQRHPGHHLLLEAYATARPGHFLAKPKLGREGEGIRPADGQIDRGEIVQRWFPVKTFEGIQPVIGSWVIGDCPAGIGIREERGITTDKSMFVPHYVEA